MRTTIVVAAAFMALGTGVAGAAGGTTGGSGGLALAALVGAHAPAVSAANKRALTSMLDGRLAFRSYGTIKVDADSVSCRSSDVDISHHDCTLKFGRTTRTLSGRAAHELFATLIETGVPGDGAAGSIYEALSHLACTINPAEVKQRAGGGANCTFSPGP